MPGKSKKTAKRKPNVLLVVAHPDDETLFFGGTILSTATKYNWHVVCVTDGNADGLGAERQLQFKKACKALGAKTSVLLTFQDIFEQRLPVQALSDALEEYQKLNFFKNNKLKGVFTHGILGEYSHPHHQDVSFAVHKVFSGLCDVNSTAYNIFPDTVFELSAKNYDKKTKILWDIYAGEIKRFINFLPATWTEGFTRVTWKEVEALYHWITTGTSPEKRIIKTYRWLLPYIEQGGAKLHIRPF